MLTFDFREWEAKASAMTAASNQVPFVIAVALTKAMQDAREAERALMRSVFDRPTRYTLNSMQVVPATKANLTASIRLKDFPRPAWKWLGVQITGGARGPKAYELALRAAGILKPGEFTVPGKGVALDAYGNIRGSTIVRILSQLGAAQRTAGYMANMTARSRKRAIRKAGGQYVLIRGVGARNGIYQRKGRTVVPVLIFVRQPQYKARFPYYDEARRVIPAAFHRHSQWAWERYVLRDIARR